jgi:hypothetical protein
VKVPRDAETGLRIFNPDEVVEKIRKGERQFYKIQVREDLVLCKPFTHRHLRLRKSLDFSESHFGGNLNFWNMEILGRDTRLNCYRIVVDKNIFGPAFVNGTFDMRRAIINGIADFTEMVVLGEVNLGSAQIDTLEMHKRVEDWLNLSDSQIRIVRLYRLNIGVSISMRQIQTESIDLNAAVIEGHVFLNDAKIKDYGKIKMDGTIIKGFLDIQGVDLTTLNLDFSFKSGPTKIICTPDQADILHLAAPNIPLYIIRKPENSTEG